MPSLEPLASIITDITAFKQVEDFIVPVSDAVKLYIYFVGSVKPTFVKYIFFYNILNGYRV